VSHPVPNFDILDMVLRVVIDITVCEERGAASFSIHITLKEI
jgi:hypothetical protein